MKFFILLTCILATAIAVDYQTNVRLKISQIMPECIKEVGANEADVAELQARKALSRMEGKCLVSCLQKKVGLQDENGEPSRDGLLKLLEPLESENPELYAKLIELGIKCGPAVTALGLKDHCEIATEIARCGLKEGKAIGLDNPFMI